MDIHGTVLKKNLCMIECRFTGIMGQTVYNTLTTI